MNKKNKPVVSLTMDEAEKLGIVVCAHCGYPPNNHFGWDEADLKSGYSDCAHRECPGYKPKFRMGKTIR